MGIYEKKVYKKVKDGSWLCVSCSYENLPYGVDFWKKSLDMEKKSKLGEHTYLSIKKSGVSSKCVSIATTYFGNREKVVRTLIESSKRKVKNGRNTL